MIAAGKSNALRRIIRPDGVVVGGVRRSSEEPSLSAGPPHVARAVWLMLLSPDSVTRDEAARRFVVRLSRQQWMKTVGRLPTDAEWIECQVAASNLGFTVGHCTRGDYYLLLNISFDKVYSAQSDPHIRRIIDAIIVKWTAQSKPTLFGDKP